MLPQSIRHLLFAALLASGAFAQGPVVLLGIDGEDSGHGGPIPYATVLGSVITNVTNGGAGMLVIGAGKSPTDNVTVFWNQVAANAGIAITEANGGAIGTIPFAGYAVIAIASSERQTPSGGLTPAENTALAGRAVDIATHVNGGGGLYGLSQAGQPVADPYAYLGAIGAFVSAPTSTSAITPTPEGLAVGITATNLDVCCWHDNYTTFPNYLNVLATDDRTGRPCALGGSNIVIVQGIALTPTTASRVVGNSITLTARVADSQGNLIANTSVSFGVTSGPNIGQSAVALTDATGVATFSYTGGPNPGTDLVDACFIDNTSTLQCETSTISWNVPPGSLVGLDGPRLLCDGETAIFSVDRVGGSGAIAWSVTGPLQVVTTAGTTASIIATAPGNGTVSARLAGSNTLTADISIVDCTPMVPPAPPPPIPPASPPPPTNPGPGSNCQIELATGAPGRMRTGTAAAFTTTLTNIQAGSVRWSVSPASAASITGASDDAATVTFAEAGTITVRVEGDCAGNPGASDDMSLTFDVVATVEQDGLLNNPICAGLGFAGGCVCPPGQDVAFPDIGQSNGVLPHSGQELRIETDLMLKGIDRATDLVISRRHMTRVNYADSIFGPAWAFNYRQTIREIGGALELESFGRVDRFVADPNASNAWIGTRGRFDRVVLDVSTNTFALRHPHGTRVVFAAEGPAGSRQAVMTHLVSPNGNQLEFRYESATQQPSILQRKLLAIIDSFGRATEFEYEDADYPDGVSHIRDFTGRVWSYDYDANGDLRTVRSPIVTSAASGNFSNNFPTGKVRRYSYVGHIDPRLNHALASIEFPNQVNGGSFHPRLAWTYESDAASPFFGYVATHTIGNRDAGLAAELQAGGTYSYSYTLHPHTPATPADATNVPVVQVTIDDRRGVRKVLDFSAFGQMLAEHIPAQGLRTSPPASSYVRRFTYNADGDLVSSIDAKGSRTLHAHASQNGPRTSQANETELLRLPDGTRSADQVSIRSVTVYEPLFNRPYKVIDPRGFEPGNSSDAFTTTFVFDYMEDLDAAAESFAPQLGMTTAELVDLFSSLGIEDRGADVNLDGVTNQQCGNVIAVIRPTVDFTADLPEAGHVLPGLVQSAIELTHYNRFGQVVLQRDAEENVTRYQYLDNELHRAGGNASETQLPGGGYLERIIRDDAPLSPNARNSGQQPPTVSRVTAYEYGAQADGAFPANLRGVPTAMIDPRGIKHIYLVNELDQVVVSREAVVAPAGSGLTAFGYERRTKFDANDNIVAIEIQNKDTLDGANDFIRDTFEFDVLDQLRREVRDAGSGNLNITSHFDYDPSQNLTRKTRAVGRPEATVDEWTHDERDIVVTRRRGATGTASGENAVFTSEIDRNGNITAWIDADGGDRTVFEFDGYDRERRVIEREGDETVRTFDSAANVVRVERRGPAEPGGTATTLAETRFFFDPRNRLYRTDNLITHYPGRSVGMIDPGAGSRAAGYVTELTIHDRSDRVVGVIDAEYDLFETRYDGLGRVIHTIDAMTPTNETIFEYDDSDNLTRVTEVERSALIASAEERFVSRFTYDTLNRLQTATEPSDNPKLTQTNRYRYDSRDNLVKTIDQLGNETEYRHDRMSRMLSSTRYLAAIVNSEAINASASNNDPTQGGIASPGMIRLEQTWDDLDRLVSRTDDSGATTLYTYDDLDRKTGCSYADGTTESWTWNKDSELLTHTNQNGSVETWTHDRDGRPTQLTVNNSGASTTVAGTTRKTWAYDGLDRITRATDNNGAPPVGAATDNDVTCQYVYDSLSRRIRETQTIGARQPLQVDTEWQGMSRNVRLTFPYASTAARAISRSYDALDRLTEISEVSTGGSITRFEYVGPRRDGRITHGNMTVLTKVGSANSTTAGAGAGYDSQRRHVRHTWTDSTSGMLTSYVTAYNGPGGLGTNRRIREDRLHLGRGDDYLFDSAYRMVGFVRNIDLSNPAGGIRSSRTLDGADNMTTFFDEGATKSPVIGTVNQYAQFAGAARTYTDNDTLEDDATFTYVYDFQNRLVELRSSTTGNRVARYTYTPDNRRVLRELGTSPAAAESRRYLYDGWRVCEERDGNDIALRQYVDGRGIDEHCQLKDLTQSGAPEYYYHCNAQGFTGALTDAAQRVVEYYEYSWLGRPTVLNENAAGTVHSVDDYTNPGQWVIEENFTSPFGWADDELAGYEIELATDAGIRRFPITTNISFWENASTPTAPRRYTNKYTLSVDPGTVVLNSTYRVIRPLDSVRGQPGTTTHAGTTSGVDWLGNAGTTEVSEQNASTSFATNGLAGKVMRITTVFGIDRHYTIQSNSSTGSPGSFTNSFVLVGDDIDNLLSVSGDAFEIQEPTQRPSLVGNAYMFHGRRFDAESENYYFRNRYYNPATGRFISFDTAGGGNWAHGQGNSKSGFAEDPWNVFDPMGLAVIEMDDEKLSEIISGSFDAENDQRDVCRVLARLIRHIAYNTEDFTDFADTLHHYAHLRDDGDTLIEMVRAEFRREFNGQSPKDVARAGGDIGFMGKIAVNAEDNLRHYSFIVKNSIWGGGYAMRAIDKLQQWWADDGSDRERESRAEVRADKLASEAYLEIYSETAASGALFASPFWDNEGWKKGGRRKAVSAWLKKFCDC